MKKNLLLLFFISTTLASCYSQELSKKIDNSIGGNLFLNTAGTFYLKHSSSNTLLLLFKTKGVENLSYDKSFIIYSETGIPKFSFDESDYFEVKIAESKKYAVIYNVTKNKIHFIGTTDAHDNILNIKNDPSLQLAICNSDYLGYGFSYLTGSWSENRIKESKYITPTYSLDYSDNFNTQLRATLPLDDDGGGGNLCAQGNCSSGGNGSSSCSISEPLPPQSCTVTCSTGFYACCNSSSVRCYCCKY